MTVLNTIYNGCGYILRKGDNLKANFSSFGCPNNEMFQKEEHLSM